MALRFRVSVSLRLNLLLNPPTARTIDPPSQKVPEWMLSLKKEKPKDRRKLEISAPKRRRISTVSGWDKQRSFKKKQARAASQQRRQQEGVEKGEGEE